MRWKKTLIQLYGMSERIFIGAFPARFFGSCSTAFYTADLYSSFSTAWDDDARNRPNQNSAVLLMVMRRTFPFEPIESENLFRS